MLLNLREDYQSPKLEITDLGENPFVQFHHWFQDALKAGVREPNAMTLATCTPEGRPSARIVLLKGYGEDGFTFFTNYESRKGKELSLNPYAALVFLWLDLHRQIRIEGCVEKMDDRESEAYFQSRPRGSQLGAWASPQSQVLSGRKVLEEKVKLMEKQFEGIQKLPLPSFWGGYVLKPDVVEFWQGQTSRLHDRLRYVLQPEGEWEIERLAP